MEVSFAALRRLRFAASIILIVSFSACVGGMDPLFPGGNSYRIRASVNGVSIEDGLSIVRRGDEISPYFVTIAENDPDITSIVAYLVGSLGEVQGSRVSFVLAPTARVGRSSIGPFDSDDDDDDPDADDDDGDDLPYSDGENLPDEETDDWEIGEREILVESFCVGLPGFTLPRNLALGEYALVFDALGRRGLLQRSEISFFYIGDAEFSLTGISMSLPTPYDMRAIPAETKVLLEAQLNHDVRLDPHLVWFSGRNVLHQGRASEGAGSILWEAPRQTAFHPLRLDVLPFDPGSSRRGGFSGISREISLPVSATATSDGAGFFFGAAGIAPRNRLAEGVFHLDAAIAELAAITAAREAEGEPPPAIEYDPEPPQLQRWYRFEGRLRDTLVAGDEERFLEPLGDAAPLWTSIGQSYGLSTGPDRAFALSPVDFFRGEGDEEEEGGGVLLFHLRAVSDGSILSAVFPSRMSDAAAWIDLSRSGDALVLRLGTRDSTEEIPVFLSGSDWRGLVPVAVKFYARGDRLEAGLGLGSTASLQSRVAEVPLAVPLTGEVRIRLGGATLNQWTRPPTQFGFPADVHVDDAADAPLVADLSADDPEAPVFAEADGEDFPEARPEGLPATVIGMETRAFSPTISAVWNEFAVMRSFAPFPEPWREEEIVAEGDGEDADAAVEPIAVAEFLAEADESAETPDPSDVAESAELETWYETADGDGEGEAIASL